MSVNGRSWIGAALYICVSMECLVDTCGCWLAGGVSIHVHTISWVCSLYIYPKYMTQTAMRMSTARGRQAHYLIWCSFALRQQRNWHQTAAACLGEGQCSSNHPLPYCCYVRYNIDAGTVVYYFITTPTQQNQHHIPNLRSNATLLPNTFSASKACS